MDYRAEFFPSMKLQNNYEDKKTSHNPKSVESWNIILGWIIPLKLVQALHRLTESSYSDSAV